MNRLAAPTAALCAALLCWSAGAPTALAFKVGVHYDLTYPLLVSYGFDVDSADEVADSNYWTDIYDQFDESAHADDGRFDLASERLRDKLQEIAFRLNACHRRTALDALGEALHTVQDVYAHSNAVDNDIEIPDILNMERGTATCDGRWPSPDVRPPFAPGSLVSGYFSLFGYLDGWPDPRGQCRGMPEGRCCHHDLNKDNDEPSETPNHGKHTVATAFAEDASLEYLEQIERTIGNLFTDPELAAWLLDMLKRKQRTVVFAIDDTGSMKADIQEVEDSVDDFVDALVAGEEAPTLGLLTFKDSVDSQGLTCDLRDFRRRIDALRAEGGGDCPEASNQALLEAISLFPVVGTDVQLFGGILILATDASARRPELGPAVKQKALSRGISIFPILTGDCEEEEPPPGAVANAGDDDPLTSSSGRTQFRALADETGGVAFLVDRNEVGSVTNTLLELSDPQAEVFYTRRVSLTPDVVRWVDIPVDDGFFGSSVSFLVATRRAGDAIPALVLQRPDGSIASPEDPDVELLSLASESLAIYDVDDPELGTWKLFFTGTGEFAVRAFGKTSMRLNSLILFDPAAPPVRPEVDMMPVEGDPLVGADLVVEARFTQAPATVMMAAIDLEGNLIQELVATPEGASGRRFRAALSVPDQTFRIVTGGLTEIGWFYLRDAPVHFAPQRVALDVFPDSLNVPAGAEAVLQATVTNATGAEATLRFSGVEVDSWGVTLPEPLTLAAGGVTTVELRVSVPADAEPGTTHDVTFLVEDVATPSTRNSDAVAIAVPEPHAPVLTLCSLLTLVALKRRSRRAP